MQSLSVTNLQVLEIDDSIAGNGKHLKVKSKAPRFMKNNDDSSNKHLNSNKFNLKLSLTNLIPNKNKYSLNRNDSGYISNTSAETVFSIDSSNYVSFRNNPYLQRRQIYNSSQSLYDKSPVDLSEVFGLKFSNSLTDSSSDYIEADFDSPKHLSLQSPLQLKSSQEYSVENPPKPEIKYENRSWDQIKALSDEALNQWLINDKKSRVLVNNVFDLSKKFQYFEPNIEVKNSLLLNQNLLYQPIRRYTSEINIKKLIFESSELFCDDSQLENTFVRDDSKFDKNIYYSNNHSEQKDRETKDRVADEIYNLFIDLHEFRINDENISRVSDKICKIERYLISQISSQDIGYYLMGKTCCGCRLSSLCSVIQFGQALNNIVVDCIDNKIAVYQRIAYIIAFIKLSLSLYQKSNWQSLNTLVSALHSFKIYRLNNEWQQIRRNHKYYFDEFVKLTTIICSSETSLMYSIPKGIPALRSILLTQQVNCMARWDRMEKPTKWQQHPGIIDWLERQLKNNMYKQRHQLYEYLESDSKTGKQLICFIQLRKMPGNWLNRSTRNIPLELRGKVLNYLSYCLKSELNFC